MNNKEFLFIYDATLCNPNGDPDRGNEPRMDKVTETNFVSDGRLKRYIRDYLIDIDKPIFVSMVGGQKVSPPTRLNGIIEELESNETKFNELVKFDEILKQILDNYKENVSVLTELNYHQLFLKRNVDVKSKQKEKSKEKKEEDKILKSLKSDINNAVLVALIRKEFIDIRYFGGAFAIGDFSQTITGSIQINMGYSLHPVKLKSDAIVTIMGTSDGVSGMGKKELLYYSLIAFTGTINSKKAEFIKLTDADITDFRDAIIKSVQDTRTDSKKNQYTKLYLEIEYKEDEIYGRLGDLRDHVAITSNVKDKKNDLDFEKVRRFKDLSIDFSDLYEKINLISDKIEKIRIWKAVGFDALDETKINAEIEILDI